MKLILSKNAVFCNNVILMYFALTLVARELACSVAEHKVVISIPVLVAAYSQACTEI